MSSPISILQQIGIPIHSYVAAAQAAGAMRASCDFERYCDLITKINGNADHFKPTTFPMAQMLFGYLVQEVVRAHLVGENLELYLPIAFDVAREKATAFVDTQPWHWPESNNGDGKVTRLDEVRRYVAMFDGISKDVIISRLCDDFEVTKPTALSWLRLLAGEEDQTEVKPRLEKVKIVNKSDKAVDIVRELFDGSNKNDVINHIIKKLATTHGGAQTFFYAAIKKLNLSPAKSTAQVAKQSTQDTLRLILEANPEITRKDFISKAEEVGVKPTTAQTYYYALTATLGVDRKGTASRGRKCEGATSRIDQVITLVSEHNNLSKQEIMTLLSEKFTVSKVSAQSYYYAAKKALKEPQQ